MRSDPAARDARDVNRDVALRALQERDQARRELATERAKWARWHDEMVDGRIGASLRRNEEIDRAESWEIQARGWKDQGDQLGARLAAIDSLHQPDGHACGCGLTDCPTRRELDR